MKKLKAIITILLIFSMSTVMSVTVFASRIEEKKFNKKGSEKIYSQLIDCKLKSDIFRKKCVTGDKSLGLALDVGKSGFSAVVSFRFNSLPVNAKVRKVEIIPGKGVLNGGKRNLMGVVVFSKLKITSPTGKNATIAWNPQGMEDNSRFFNQNARGTWTAQVVGSNVSRPTGNSMIDLRSFGALSYKSAQMQISYALE